MNFLHFYVTGARCRDDEGLETDQRTCVRFTSVNALTTGNTKSQQTAAGKTGQQESQPWAICKTSIPGSNPGGASNSKSNRVKQLQIEGGPDGGPVRGQTDVSFRERSTEPPLKRLRDDDLASDARSLEVAVLAVLFVGGSKEANVEAVKMSIALGNDPNAQAETGRTALSGAGHKGTPLDHSDPH